MVLPIEKALIRNQWPQMLPTPTDASSDSIKLSYDVVQGNFKQALTSQLARDLFSVQSSDGSLAQNFSHLAESAEGEEEELVRLAIAVALLHAFIQANWTGPDLDFRPSDILSPTALSEEDLNAKSTAELAYGGEPAFHLSKFPIYLRLAQIILLPDPCQDQEVSNLKRLKTAPWWTLRLTLLHQHMLDEPVPPPEMFSSALSTSLETLITHLDADDLCARLLLSQGLLSHVLSQSKLASTLFNRALNATGLQCELTGALGKRTKFQQEDLSQLVVLAESRLNLDTASTSGPTSVDGMVGAEPTVPKTLALNDDTLLETTQYSAIAPSTSLSHLDPSAQPALHPLDQTVLLVLTLTLLATSPSSDPLTSSQSSAYISRVLSNPRNWSIHTMALLLRSRLEASRTRTVERALLQIQALVDQMPATDKEKTESEKGASVQERLEYIWELLLPSKWALEKELADKYFSIGVVKAALEIYERLEMWEQVVKCYSVLEKPEKGIDIVKDLLEGRKKEAEVVIVDGKTTISKERRRSLDRAREAKLLCLLGDLEPADAAAHYSRAWAVSGHTSSRAMRSLGGIRFSLGQYSEVIDCLRKAVKINPLVGRAWFVLGCAYMRVEDWEGAREAFTRCVRIDEEDGESWSNLAGVYLRMPAAQLESNVSAGSQHKLLAFQALKQGLKSSHSNWKMWYNYMVVCVDVGELFEAARALGRVVEETGGRSSGSGEDHEAVIDLDVVDRLVDAVVKGTGGMTEKDGQPTGLTRAVTHLFEATLLPRVSSSPRLFRAYAKLMRSQGRWDEVLKAYLDAYRVGPAGTWGGQATDGPEVFTEAVREVEEMVDLMRNFGPRVEGGNKGRWKAQARSIVRTLMARTKETHEGDEGWRVLFRLSQELKRACE